MPDMELAVAACRAAQSGGHEISDTCARVIASMYHGGQWSRGYALASSGAIVDGSDGLCSELFGDYATLSPNAKMLYDMMGTYLLARVREGRTGPVTDWHKLWLS